MMVFLEIMGIPLYIEKIGFTIREETFCSLITTIDLLIMEPSQKKVNMLCIILSLLIIQATSCVLILISHDEEHMKHLEAHGFLIL